MLKFMAGALVVVLLSTPQAYAAGAAVERACSGDYFAYCGKHDPNSAGVRRCMRANESKLSQGCINALVAAGEVSKAETRTARK